MLTLLLSISFLLQNVALKTLVVYGVAFGRYGRNMEIQSVIAGIVVLFLLIYLVYTLIYPEKF
jgi:K+-transporting ATPase KdpF subunit